MLRFLADENLSENLVRGALRVRTIDVVRAQEVGLASRSDPDLLDWAAQADRVIISHDVNTLPGFAWQRVAQGNPMVGLLIVPSRRRWANASMTYY